MGRHRAQPDGLTLLHSLVSFLLCQGLQAPATAAAIAIRINDNVVVTIGLLVDQRTEKVLKRMQIAGPGANQRVRIASSEGNPQRGPIFVVVQPVSPLQRAQQLL